MPHDRALLPRRTREAVAKAIDVLIQEAGGETAAAKRVGVSQQAINKAKNAAVGPLVAENVAEALGMTLTELVEKYGAPVEQRRFFEELAQAEREYDQKYPNGYRAVRAYPGFRWDWDPADVKAATDEVWGDRFESSDHSLEAWNALLDAAAKRAKKRRQDAGTPAAIRASADQLRKEVSGLPVSEHAEAWEIYIARGYTPAELVAAGLTRPMATKPSPGATKHAEKAGMAAAAKARGRGPGR